MSVDIYMYVLTLVQHCCTLVLVQGIRRILCFGRIARFWRIEAILRYDTVTKRTVTISVTNRVQSVTFSVLGGLSDWDGANTHTTSKTERVKYDTKTYLL